MKCVIFSGAVGLVLVGVVGCRSQQAQSPPSQSSAAENALTNPTPQNFAQPIIASASKSDKNSLSMATVPVKVLLQSSQPRSSTSISGPDPFGTLLPEGAISTELSKFSKPQLGKPTTPIWKKPIVPTAKIVKIAAKSQKTSLRPIPSAVPLGFIPPIQISKNRPPLPAISDVPIGNNPAVPTFVEPLSPTALADEVEITGVVQAGDRVMAIIKAPEESTARYVNAGDTLSGGRVIVREIRVGQAGQPTVVLEQNGQRVTKSIGVIARMTAFRGL
jgi:hypothetical protein